MGDEGIEGEGSDSLRARIFFELHPSRFIPNLIAGIVVSIIVVIVSVSLATLIFAGELSEYLPRGIGIVLFSGIIITGVTSLASSYPGMIAYPQERVAPIFAVIAAAIVSDLSGLAPKEEIFLTVVASITVASLANGLFLSALGVFNLGGLIRFIPYPVIGGFLAGTGWLLVRGSIGVMTGIHLHASDLLLLMEGEVLPKWTLGVGYGILMVLISRRSSHFMVMPTLLLGGVALFYLAAPAMGISIDSIREGGWLIGPFPETEAWTPLSYAALTQANWDSILAQTGNLGTILLISVISVLLNSGALELAAEVDIDLNRELKAAGSANFLIGLGGGTVGFHSLSISRLVLKMGARSRIVGVIAALACGLMLLLGPNVMSFLPRIVLGGLLFFLGMHFLVEWTYEAWFRLTRADYAIVIMILFFVAALGYLHGVGVGIIACIMLFLINYSQVNVVKLAISGAHQQSNVDRPAPHYRLLNSEGERLNIFKLQGFIFFGTANKLLNQVRARLADHERAPLRYMLLDFKHVTGIDSSSTLSFLKMRQLAEKNDFTLIFTQPSAEIRRQLDKEDFDQVSPEVYQTFGDLDHGLEWCENQILASKEIPEEDLERISVRRQLGEEFPSDFDLEKLLGHFERMEVERGYALMRQGEPSDELYLIEEGQVTASVQSNKDESIRLRTLRAGTIVGEIGLILNEPRSATVTADRPSVLYRLSSRSLSEMQRDDPETAVQFHHFITRLLAERLSTTNNMIRTILD